MDINLHEGISLTNELIVTEEKTALNMGSGDLEVYATPSMIAFMENTSKNLVIESLPEGYTTVGINISVDHIKSSPIGANIKCTSTLKSINGKKLFFDVEASDDQGIIGKGTHIRYIVNVNNFMDKTNNK